MYSLPIDRLELNEYVFTLTNIVMIMMMTVMMMVFMPMDNWLLPIMITHVIVSATVPLTVMMLIVSVMMMWPQRCIGKTK